MRRSVLRGGSGGPGLFCFLVGSWVRLLIGDAVDLHEGVERFAEHFGEAALVAGDDGEDDVLHVEIGGEVAGEASHLAELEFVVLAFGALEVVGHVVSVAPFTGIGERSVLVGVLVWLGRWNLGSSMSTKVG